MADLLLKQRLETGLYIEVLDQVYEQVYKESLYKGQKTEDASSLVDVFK